jgi:hypothetical protein
VRSHGWWSHISPLEAWKLAKECILELGQGGSIRLQWEVTVFSNQRKVHGFTNADEAKDAKASR